MDLEAFERRVQSCIDEGHSLPVVFVPKGIGHDAILKNITNFDLVSAEKDVLKAIAFYVGKKLGEGIDDGIVISVDEICDILKKSTSSVKRWLMSSTNKSLFEREKISVKSKYGVRQSKCFKLTFPDIDTLNSTIIKREELPTFVQGGTMYAPLRRGEQINSALMDEIITGVLAPCLHLQQRGVRDDILINVVTLFGKKVQVTTRGLTGIDIAHVLDLRYYIAILSCVERIMRGALDDNLKFTDTFSLPISDIVRSTGKKNESPERRSAIAAIDRLRSTTFELNDIPEEITDSYEIETDGGMWTIDPLSNVSYSKLNTKNGQQIISFQLPSIIVSALELRAKQKTQSLLRLISPVMYTEKNLLFVFLLQVRRLVQLGKIQSVPWYMMRDHSSPGMDIIEFKKRLSKLLVNHKGLVSSKLNHDSILIKYEANINGFNIKIIDSSFEISFDPSDNALIDPLYHPQKSLFSS